MIKNIHMLGICGTGMGSLALLLKEAGYHVTGSDENVYPPMSTQLEDAGIQLFKGYKKENLKGNTDIVIIGNVISRGNPEAEEVLAQGLRYMSMPEATKEFFLKDKHSIVIAGTHGKTTTATLCAWLLDFAGMSPGFLIGGVGKNFGVSARLCSSRASSATAKPFFVIEGDEYDTAFFDKGPKFLHYMPQSVILGPVEFDHADIYRDLNHVMSSFEKLINIIPKDGLLVACSDSQNTMKLAQNAACRVVTYGVSKNIHVDEKGTHFELNQQFTSPLYGNHNLQNTIGVITLLKELGIPDNKIAKGLSSFEGVRRRQEVCGVVNGIAIIDDFAHHPTAVRETIEAMRMKYPKRTHPARRIFAIFEPRSNTSKRNIFQDEFATALVKSDVAVISGLHRPDKVPTSERLDVEKLAADINKLGGKAHYIDKTDEIVKFVTNNAQAGDVLLVMSNGGFDDIHKKLLRSLGNAKA